MSANSFIHAAQVLRSSDCDRYLSTLVLNGVERDGVTALYAFNADVSSIRDRVTSPAPGEMRLQWWNDVLEGAGHGTVRQNPVADALLQTIERYAIPSGTLMRLIGARRFDLYDDPMPDLESFEGYAGDTASTLYQLAAMILNGGGFLEAGDAAGHLGVAHAMIGHLRAFGLVSSQGRIMLPWSIFAAHGVQEESLFSGKSSDSLENALSQIIELARVHLDKAETAIEQLPNRLKPAFVSIAVLRAQLALVQKSVAAPFIPKDDDPDWRKIIRLVWWSLRNR